MTTIAIIEDHPLVIEAIKQLFRNDDSFKIVGEADTGEKAVEVVREHKPDVAILDITLPDVSGLDLCPLFADVSPQTKVVFFSMHDQVSHVHRALSGGAMGYVLKSAPVDCLLEAVKEVQAGRYYLSPEVNQTVVKGFLGGEAGGHGKGGNSDSQSPLPGGLSHREFQILQLVLDGATNKRIAELLCLSPKTVEKHRANIMEKAKASTPMALFRFAIRNKIIDPGCWV